MLLTSNAKNARQVLESIFRHRPPSLADWSRRLTGTGSIARFALLVRVLYENRQRKTKTR
jgi:hypothetical protein